MSIHSIQELEHGLRAAFQSLIYSQHKSIAQGEDKGDENENEDEVEVEVHRPYVLLTILSFLLLPDL